MAVDIYGFEPEKEKKSVFEIISLILVIAGALMVIYSLLIVFLGDQASAKLTELRPSGSRYINHYEYEADGVIYNYDVRTSRKDSGKIGDVTTVFYLKGHPSLTYSKTVFYLGLVITFIGALFFLTIKKKQSTYKSLY